MAGWIKFAVLQMMLSWVSAGVQLTSLPLGCNGVDLSVSADGNVLAVLCDDQYLYMYHRSN